MEDSNNNACRLHSQTSTIKKGGMNKQMSVRWCEPTYDGTYERTHAFELLDRFRSARPLRPSLCSAFARRPALLLLVQDEQLQ
ncbi:unnamed protein product [Ectocarpus sp. CCAP 1310/34]|nr:unnamed protein product [Ectocarpus sp. CCAP 1310/34]